MYSTTKLYSDITEEAWLIEPMLEVLMALHIRSTGTWKHLGDVARYAVTFGRALSLSNEELLNLQCAALLHDVGKIMASPDLLEKTTPLERDEWYTITKHPVLASKVLKEKTLPAGVISAAQYHHERYDGHGYPDEIAGESIPTTARILTTVDSYSAIVDQRPYKNARSHAEAVEELKRCAGTQFDPKVVDAFIGLFDSGVLTPEE